MSASDSPVESPWIAFDGPYFRKTFEDPEFLRLRQEMDAAIARCEARLGRKPYEFVDISIERIEAAVEKEPRLDDILAFRDANVLADIVEKHSGDQDIEMLAHRRRHRALLDQAYDLDPDVERAEKALEDRRNQLPSFWDDDTRHKAGTLLHLRLANGTETYYVLGGIPGEKGEGLPFEHTDRYNDSWVIRYRNLC